ncbi:MAG TPA: sigma-70 family RNA polymerase sigma factor [Phycisphaerae bacterium]|nr:sigma-70 family RNA polymerase sigma factor [Phycisphaerae bacterium]
MASPDNQVLLERAVGGDSAALGDLLKRLALELARDIQLDDRWAAFFDVNDVLQVTFLEAFLRIHWFVPDGPGSFSGWLLTIARNNLRDMLREVNRAKRPPPDRRLQPVRNADTHTTLLHLLTGDVTSPSRGAAGREARGSLESAIARLPESYALVVRLYDLEERPIDEVASRAGRSHNAVYMLRARAHDRLRELLGPEADFFTRIA